MSPLTINDTTPRGEVHIVAHRSKELFAIFVGLLAVCGTGLFVTIPGTAAREPSPIETYNLDDSGRRAFQAGVTCEFPAPEGGSTCTAQIGPVPDGHRLVLREVSVALHLSGPNETTQVALALSGNTWILPLLWSAGSVPVLMYFDSGNMVDVAIRIPNDTVPIAGAAQTVTLKGYVVNCAVAPCGWALHSLDQ
jgi:hypothetical protein